ncbi:nuclear transport factor 2 family protein [Streptomyces sp. NPDC090080]|uniref:nuclear transport factor 2 family protein n=1 Tax=Streptomyces sp. NPDC090080 TaxID=3365939 RepID=UPI0037F97E63
MKTAAELVQEFTQSFRQGGVDKAMELFAEDATFQLPYLASVGIQSSYHGHEEIRGFLDLVLELYPDWAFDPADTKILIDTPDQAFAEYISRPTAAATGRKIEHLFMGRLVAENGKIKLLREALNTVAAAQALMPGGPADIPMPEGVIRSF